LSSKSRDRPSNTRLESGIKPKTGSNDICVSMCPKLDAHAANARTAADRTRIDGSDVRGNQCAGDNERRD